MLQPSYGLVQHAETYEADARSFEKSEQQKLETHQSAIGELCKCPGQPEDEIKTFCKKQVKESCGVWL